MKKKLSIFFLLLAISLSMMTGCGKERKQKEYEVFYLNSDITTLIPQEVKLEHTDGVERIEELLEDLQTQPKDAGVLQTIPANVKILNVNASSYQITVDFSEEYHEMEATKEILTRAAIAKTLLQNTDYLYVVFTVESQPLTNADGVSVGAMSLDSFVENPGEQISSSQITTLKLYFSNQDGTALVPETREVHYSSNISLEKLVIEQLMEGPKENGLLATVPSGTKLITISVVDGVCYVNLDEIFLNQNQEISEQVVLYSVVDSLTELSTIDKVQISINGDTSGKCRYTYAFSEMYEADFSMLEPTDGEKGIASTE
jgi:germination protein M